MKRNALLIIALATCFALLFVFFSFSGLAQPTKGASIAGEEDVFKFIFLVDGEEKELKLSFDSSIGWNLLSPTPCYHSHPTTTESSCLTALPANVLSIIKKFEVTDLYNFDKGITKLCEGYASVKIGNNPPTFFAYGEEVPLPSNLSSPLWDAINGDCLTQIKNRKDLAMAAAEGGGEVSVQEEENALAVSLAAACPECKEIDLVWLEAGKLLQISMAMAEKVWSGSQWILFALAYPPETSSYAQIKPSSTAYDQLIIKYSKENSVAPSLIKAITEHESGFNPNAISATGCSGLMQICGGSAQPEYIQVQCKQNRNLGPQKCGACSPWKENLMWCLPCSDSYCQEDDRFNPEKNIASGARLFKKHLDNCNGDLTCGLNKYGGVAVGGAKSTYPAVIIKNSQKFTDLNSQ